MRVLKFRFWKNKQLMGFRELNTGGIIDIPWDWDSVDQFTGLLDKTGVEIYEGDVLNTADGNMVVEWNPDGQWVINDPDIDLWNPLWKWAKLGSVIGNVYEHPELVG